MVAELRAAARVALFSRAVAGSCSRIQVRSTSAAGGTGAGADSGAGEDEGAIAGITGNGPAGGRRSLLRLSGISILIVSRRLSRMIFSSSVSPGW
jgi:hypothetical protein